MAISLIVETGHGYNNANSYVAATPHNYADGAGGMFSFGADQYFADRMVPTNPPNQLWFPQPKADQVDPNAELKTACLIQASSFLDAFWRALFKGQKKTQAQTMCWPRVGATIDEGAYDTAVVFWPGYGKSISTFIIGNEQIPIQVLTCCCELAARSAALGCFTYPGELAPDITGDQFVISEKIGPIEVTYKDQKPTITLFRKCEMLLAPILRGGGGSTIPLVRG